MLNFRIGVQLMMREIILITPNLKSTHGLALDIVVRLGAVD